MTNILKLVLISIAIIIILYTAIQFNNGEQYLKAPNGLSFNTIRGYESWDIVSSHYRTDRNEIRYILGNNKVIEAYKNGAGKNNEKFPDGSILVKIGYSVKENPDYNVSIEPNTLQRVEYMIKDSTKFKETYGWGYARFIYNSDTGVFTPYGNDENFHHECASCHTIVERKDYVFTDYVIK